MIRTGIKVLDVLGRHQDMVLWKTKCKLKPLYGSVVINYAAASSANSVCVPISAAEPTPITPKTCRNDSLESAGNEGRFWKKRLADFLGACFYWHGPIYFNSFSPWLEVGRALRWPMPVWQMPCNATGQRPSFQILKPRPTSGHG